MFFRKHFTFAQIPDLTDKVAIVTGANTGIGYIAARELARQHAQVFVASRSKDKGEAAVNQIKSETGNGKVEHLQIDLANLKSVKQAAEMFLKRDLPLHVLVNNAGIMATPWGLTNDGIEEQFATNHVGHFLFTMTLLPRIESSAPSRIVTVSSNVHAMAPSGGIDFDNLNAPNSHSPYILYAQSKLANILFTRALAKRLADRQVYANCVHPGYVATELTRGLVSSYGRWLAPFVAISDRLFAKNADDGAIPTLYAATSPEIEENNYRGEYFVPYGQRTTPSAYAQDDELAEQLWLFTEKLVA